MSGGSGFLARHHGPAFLIVISKTGSRINGQVTLFQLPVLVLFIMKIVKVYAYSEKVNLEFNARNELIKKKSAYIYSKMMKINHTKNNY